MNKQERFRETLLCAKRAFEQAGLEFFLSSGTALGAWREGQFIEHTSDIDLSCFATQNVNGMVDAMRSNEFEFQGEFGCWKSGYKAKFLHKENDVRIDVFPYYEENDHMWSATYGRTCKCMQRGYCRWKFTKFKLQEIDFMETQFLLPDPADTYMIDKYGEDWKIPKDYSHRQGIYGGFKNLIFEPSIKNSFLMISSEIGEFLNFSNSKQR